MAPAEILPVSSNESSGPLWKGSGSKHRTQISPIRDIGHAVFSRYANVLEADGTPMSIRTALEAINEELDLYFPNRTVSWMQ